MSYVFLRLPLQKYRKNRLALFEDTKFKTKHGVSENFKT